MKGGLFKEESTGHYNLGVCPGKTVLWEMECLYLGTQMTAKSRSKGQSYTWGTRTFLRASTPVRDAFNAASPLQSLKFKSVKMSVNGPVVCPI